jgi:hypothetical protein
VPRRNGCLALLAALALGVFPVAFAAAQVIGPGGIEIAPGPSTPNYTPGGIGPGGVKVAPGPAARDIPMERRGIGGVRIAPGPAGQVSQDTRSPVDALPRPETLTTKRKPPRQIKKQRRRAPVILRKPRRAPDA